MMFGSLTFASSLLLGAAHLGTLQEMSRIVRSGSSETLTFGIETSVVRIPGRDSSIFIGDGTNCLEVFEVSGSLYPLRKGDRIRLCGNLLPTVIGVQPRMTHLEFLSHGTAPAPIRCTAGEILSGRRDRDYVTVCGEIVDAAYDDIDSHFSYFTLLSDGQEIFIPMQCRPSLDALVAYVGRRVAVTGICQKPAEVRPYLSREVCINGPEDVTLCETSPVDPFSAPGLFAPTDDRSGTSRRRAHGRILAVWGGNQFLLRTPKGQVVTVRVIARSLPAVGSCVDVVGSPVVNAYGKNLVRSIWRDRTDKRPPAPTPRDLTIRSLFFDKSGVARINAENRGQIVRLCGTVREVADSGKGETALLLEDGGVFLRVLAGAANGTLGTLAVGSRVEVTGACLLEIESGHSPTAVNRIRGVFVVLRAPDDLRVLARPPWWTPGRLLALVFALLTVLTGAAVWTVLLNRRSERRGRELAAERLAHVTSELKVLERTRLAVELHDTLAQNLTGISLEVQAVRARMRDRPDQAQTRLDHIGKSLESCRRELRNCLRDLRSDALEKTDLNEAIRMTLEPHVENARVAVRFNVPRDRLTDNATHAILRIVRELVLNALRHGRATAVRVAGSVEENRLLFSVRDNGCGFDPSACPGAKEGHFGLVGIRERVNAFDGRLTIESRPGSGTKATISIELPKENDPA